MMFKDKVQLDKNLNILLKANNLTAEQLSRKTNINKSSLHNYLNGVIPKGLPALIKLSEQFSISLDQLIFEIEKEASIAQKISLQEDKFEITIKKIIPDKNLTRGQR